MKYQGYLLTGTCVTIISTFLAIVQSVNIYLLPQPSFSPPICIINSFFPNWAKSNFPVSS